MVVGVMRIEFYLHENRSLKGEESRKEYDREGKA